jgi:hypothetical protein
LRWTIQRSVACGFRGLELADTILRTGRGGVSMTKVRNVPGKGSRATE